jgi:hypothetical protein
VFGKDFLAPSSLSKLRSTKANIHFSVGAACFRIFSSNHIHNNIDVFATLLHYYTSASKFDSFLAICTVAKVKQLLRSSSRKPSHHLLSLASPFYDESTTQLNNPTLTSQWGFVSINLSYQRYIRVPCHFQDSNLLIYWQ